MKLIRMDENVIEFLVYADRTTYAFRGKPTDKAGEYEGVWFNKNGPGHGKFRFEFRGNSAEGFHSDEKGRDFPTWLMQKGGRKRKTDDAHQSEVGFLFGKELKEEIGATQSDCNRLNNDVGRKRYDDTND